MNVKHLIFAGSILMLSLSCSKDKETVTEETVNVPKEYKLIWSDEFDGDDVDENNWSFEIWDAGKVNNEWQKYVKDPNNYKVENGMLYITVTRTGDHQLGGYSSTRLSSKNKKEFKYGRIEFRAKMPGGTGTWPALWMLGANQDEVGWPKCGEIDIMEYVGYQENKSHNNVHTQYQYGNTDFHRTINLDSAEEEFHTYGMIWTKDQIKFYIDSPTNVTGIYAPANKTADNWPFSQSFYMIMNFAVGGAWGGIEGVDKEIWPQTMVVDYVRVYQLQS